MHLVGFIIRIYHDARSPERQKKTLFTIVLSHLVGFIVGIYHDARSPERHKRINVYLVILINNHILVRYDEEIAC